MSPTEIDLRNALHDGEGDGPDPDRIVRLGRARRAQRRSRVLSTAAAVVLAAGVATGGAFLARGSSDSGSGGAAKADSGGFNAAAKPSAAGSSAGGSSSAASGSRRDGIAAPSAAATGCPAVYPQLMLPGGGGTGQFGSGGKLFAKTPATLTVCAYGADGASGRPASLTLDGTNATRLADALENASTRRVYLPCPQSTTPMQNRLAIYATAADGMKLPVVTTSVQVPQCSIMATNGTAVRYNWAAPADLQQVLLSLTPRSSTQDPRDLPPASGKISKSPVR